jgi:PKD repeat protein
MRFLARLSAIAVLQLFVGLSIMAGPAAAQQQAEQPAVQRPTGPFPVLRLAKGGYAGQAAINALGARLPAIAAWYGKDEDVFRNGFLTDSNLRIDSQGRVYALGTSQKGPNESIAGTTPTAPLDQTFRLHSKADAPLKIVLNFEGASITGSRWNTTKLRRIAAGAFNTDRRRGFSAAERTAIQYIWQRVAEDFAPFDVDVTTENTAASALAGKGVVVMVTPSIKSLCNCALLAHVDSFGSGYEAPLFVFASNLNGASEKSVAESISHAVGRSLGLGADPAVTGQSRFEGYGSGADGWAPIMGNASFKELTQFTNGFYQGGDRLWNNFEDEFELMDRYLARRADEAGENLTEAAKLMPAIAGGRARAAVQGVLQREGDVDVFALDAAAGNLSVTLAPHARGANTRLKLTLLNTGGVLQPTQQADAAPGSFSWNVPGGTYFLKVEADTATFAYGNLGNYRLSAEYTPNGGAQPVAVIKASPATGSAPLEVQFDGTGSTDDQEITSYLWTITGGTSTISPSTNSTTAHTFLAAGTYEAQLTVTDSAGLSNTTTQTITVTQANTPPVAVIKVTPATGSAPLGVAFDATASTDDQEITSYLWTITGSQPAMTSESPQAQFNTTFLSAGTYEARLTVTDSMGLTSTATQTITVTEPPNTPPVAAFTASTTSGPATLTVTFDASASSDDGRIVSYNWDFGDGRKEELPTHYGIDIKNQTQPPISNYYFVPGTYVVTLTVKDDKGQVSEPARQVITVTAPNKLPVAKLFASNIKMGARHTIDFDAGNSTDDEGIVSYRWEWGDGSPATETTVPTVSHVFPSSGRYLVNLTVKDRQGAWARTEDWVGVPVGMQPSVYVSPRSPELYVYTTKDGTYSSNHLVWVETARGTPLEGAEVRWRLQGSSNVTGTATSNAKGTANIKLPLGPTTGAVCVDFIIESLSKTGFYYEPEAPVVRSYCPATVVAGQPSITFTQSGGVTVSRVSVAVTDQHGNPAPGVVLTGEWDGEASRVSATTNSTGVATFRIERSQPSCELFFLRGLSKPGHMSARIAWPYAIGCTPEVDIIVMPAAAAIQ